MPLTSAFTPLPPRCDPRDVIDRSFDLAFAVFVLFGASRDSRWRCKATREWETASCFRQFLLPLSIIYSIALLFTPIQLFNLQQSPGMSGKLQSFGAFYLGYHCTQLKVPCAHDPTVLVVVYSSWFKGQTPPQQLEQTTGSLLSQRGRNPQSKYQRCRLIADELRRSACDLSSSGCTWLSLELRQWRHIPLDSLLTEAKLICIYFRAGSAHFIVTSICRAQWCDFCHLPQHIHVSTVMKIVLS